MSASLGADASPLSSVPGLFCSLYVDLRKIILGVLGTARSFVPD